MQAFIKLAGFKIVIFSWNYSMVKDLRNIWNYTVKNITIIIIHVALLYLKCNFSLKLQIPSN